MNVAGEYIIGREGDILVNDPSVSRCHAKLIRAQDGLYLEDMDSTGGTYVNGKRIVKKKIGLTDKITLGNKYVLDIRSALQQLPMTDDEFRDAFCRLRQVYDHYTRTRLKIQSQTQGKMMIKRSVPMALPGIVMIGATTVLGPTAAVVGGIISAGAIVVGSVWGAKEQEKMPEKLFEIDEKFKVDYSCPDCKKPFGQQYSWESLKLQGQCPFCRRKFNV